MVGQIYNIGEKAYLLVNEDEEGLFCVLGCEHDCFDFYLEKARLVSNYVKLTKDDKFSFLSFTIKEEDLELLKGKL